MYSPIEKEHNIQCYAMSWEINFGVKKIFNCLFKIDIYKKSSEKDGNIIFHI